jgi:hypothetical protein
LATLIFIGFVLSRAGWHGHHAADAKFCEAKCRQNWHNDRTDFDYASEHYSQELLRNTRRHAAFGRSMFGAPDRA